MNRQVFYEPQRKGWKRLRRIFDVLALLGLVLGTVFVIGLMRMKPLPELFLRTPKRNYRALANQTTPLLKPGQKLHRSAHRKTDVKPGDVPLNSGEGLRAAYYVDYDPASYSSLKQHIHQIDLLFADWLHVISPDGILTSYSISNRPFAVVDGNVVHRVDHGDRVARAIETNKEDTEVFPMVNNYDPLKQIW